MNQDSNSSNQSKAMTPDQFDEVVAAILGGKYSWACVLILRFAGYNPLHYIPYRTYQRLVKDNQNRESPSARKNFGRNRTHEPEKSAAKGNVFFIQQDSRDAL